MRNLPGLPVLSVNAAECVGQVATVGGWVHHLRQIGALTFLILRDNSGFLQVVFGPEDDKAIITTLGAESVLTVTGRIAAESRAPGGIEMREPVVTVLSAVGDSLPINLHSPELSLSLKAALDWRPLALRHPHFGQVFRVQDALVRGFRDALQPFGFREVHTPKLLAAASESGASVFPVQYFHKRAYLAQSPQLYKQMLVGAFGRVFEVGPVFRAEPHATTRHLSEYVSLDAEIGFVESHHTVMQLLREVLAQMMTGAAAVVTTGSGASLPKVPDAIPVVHFMDALGLISRGLGENVDDETDLSPAHERWLGHWAHEEFGTDFLFVEGYPMEARPFYTAPNPANPRYSNSFDLLFRGQEIVTGGQRLHRYEEYLNALQEGGLSVDGLNGYLQAFRFGMPPHGGFAIGLERLTARLLDLANIREASLFPRDRGRLEP